MARKLACFLFTAGLFVGLTWPSFLPALRGQAGALEKAKLGSVVKLHPAFYLPTLTAEEKGFWKENGLEVEWVPFIGHTPLMSAVATGIVNVALSATTNPVLAAERGLPVILVAELVARDPFIIWVRTDSPYRHPRDLKGTRMGVTTLGGHTHAYGRVVLAAQGIEKDVRFIGAGGVPEQIAGLKVGAFESTILPLPSIAVLKVGGAIRELVSTEDYLPKPWFEHVIFARKEYGRTNPDMVRRIVRGTLQAVDFIRKNPGPTIEKIKSFQGLPYEGAKMVYENHHFTTSGRLDRRAVENVRKILLEYGVITAKAPAVDDLFTNEYLP